MQPKKKIQKKKNLKIDYVEMRNKLAKLANSKESYEVNFKNGRRPSSLDKMKKKNSLILCRQIEFF